MQWQISGSQFGVHRAPKSRDSVSIYPEKVQLLHNFDLESPWGEKFVVSREILKKIETGKTIVRLQPREEAWIAECAAEAYDKNAGESCLTVLSFFDGYETVEITINISQEYFAVVVSDLKSLVRDGATFGYSVEFSVKTSNFDAKHLGLDQKALNAAFNGEESLLTTADVHFHVIPKGRLGL